MENKFDFKDILIVPETLSDIDSRKEINIFDKNGFLPIFTAPMDTVVDMFNQEIFLHNKIYPILPRTINLERDEKLNSIPDNVWVSYGLKEFINIFLENSLTLNSEVRVLIDIANGHMSTLKAIAVEAKKKYGDKLVLMVGNIANPLTYEEYIDTGVDYIRCGIGNGSGCSTTVHTGVGYPLASLISDIYKIKYANEDKQCPKIVADGGIQNYSDIIKALALGADYVMCGGIFNKALESAGYTYAANIKTGEITIPGEKVNQYSDEIKMAFNAGAIFYKKFRGMSTKAVQKHMGREELRTSEGVTRMQKVEYTLEGWIQNFKDYLSTAMSYTDSLILPDFIGNVETIHISEQSYNRFNK